MSDWITTITLLIIYMLPWLIAGARNHHQHGAIAAINMLLGWTFIGWVVALAWAFSYIPKHETSRESDQKPAFFSSSVPRPNRKD